MLVERKKMRRKEKNLPGAQTTSDIIWAHLLHEAAISVVARSIGGV
jgi:hypothetical protein